MKYQIVYLLASVWTVAGGFVASLLSAYYVAVAFYVVGLVFLGVYGRYKLGGINTILTAFLLFFTLYGFSGPIGALGEGLSYAIFGVPPAVQEWLVSQGVAISGLIFGVGAGTLGYRALQEGTIPERLSGLTARSLSRLAVGLLGAASLMELVNYYRVGGFGMLTQGKALYQSSYASLTLTLPSHVVADIGFAMLGLSMAFALHRGGVNKKALLAAVIAVSPLLFITTVLGQRGALLAWLMVFVVGYYVFRRLESIQRTYVVIVVGTYVFMSLVFSLRATVPYALQTGDWAVVVERTFEQDKVARALDPTSNEFGAAFGNFSVYKYWADSEPLRLGSSYIAGLVVPIPGIVYPGEKPKQITYEFRDQYLSSYGRKSRISGTGFSSTLEAYMNWGIAGVAFVYFVVGFVLVQIERFRKRMVHRSSLWGLSFYLTLIPLTQLFHRSAFGTTWGTLVVSGLILVAMWVGLNLLRINARHPHVQRV